MADIRTEGLMAACNTFASNQPKLMQQTNKTAFLSFVKPAYLNFYQKWIMQWLAWYDGYVPGVHSNGGSGLFSTNIGATVVDKISSLILGGGIMYQSTTAGEQGDKAVKLMSEGWGKDTSINSVFRDGILLASAGGTSLVKINIDGEGALWTEVLRADEFFPDINPRGEITNVIITLATYTLMANKGAGSKDRKFVLVEHRYYEDMPERGELRVPVMTYTVHEASGDVTTQNFTNTCRNWQELPSKIKNEIDRDYSKLEIGATKLKRLPFTNLGCEPFRYTDRISNLPSIKLGESVLAHCMSYLFMYDFYANCFNTDMYLGRGRVLLPKHLSTNKIKDQNGNMVDQYANWNSGMDSFAYTMYDTLTTDKEKPVPVQFDLRATEWREIRNNLLESISTAIGISVGSFASYLNDASNRTAREVSSEESATTLFVEEKHRMFEAPMNKLIKTICNYYGLIVSAEVKWSKAGQSNTSVHIDNMVQLYTNGLISHENAIKSLNPDMDENQIQEELTQINAKQAEKANAFADMDFSTDINEI